MRKGLLQIISCAAAVGFLRVAAVVFVGGAELLSELPLLFLEWTILSAIPVTLGFWCLWAEHRPVKLLCFFILYIVVAISFAFHYRQVYVHNRHAFIFSADSVEGQDIAKKTESMQKELESKKTKLTTLRGQPNKSPEDHNEISRLEAIIDDHEWYLEGGVIVESVDISDFFYFSVSVMTTLGFGDIVPNAKWLKVAVALQAIAGVVLMTFAIMIFFENDSTASKSDGP